MTEQYVEALHAAGFLLHWRGPSGRSVPFVGWCFGECMEFSNGAKACVIWSPLSFDDPRQNPRIKNKSWKRIIGRANKLNQQQLSWAGVTLDILVIGDVLAVCS